MSGCCEDDAGCYMMLVPMVYKLIHRTFRKRYIVTAALSLLWLLGIATSFAGLGLGELSPRGWCAAVDGDRTGEWFTYYTTNYTTEVYLKYRDRSGNHYGYRKIYTRVPIQSGLGVSTVLRGITESCGGVHCPRVPRANSDADCNCLKSASECMNSTVQCCASYSCLSWMEHSPWNTAWTALYACSVVIAAASSLPISFTIYILASYLAFWILSCAFFMIYCPVVMGLHHVCGVRLGHDFDDDNVDDSGVIKPAFKVFLVFVVVVLYTVGTFGVIVGMVLEDGCTLQHPAYFSLCMCILLWCFFALVLCRGGHCASMCKSKTNLGGEVALESVELELDAPAKRSVSSELDDAFDDASPLNAPAGHFSTLPAGCPAAALLSTATAREVSKGMTDERISDEHRKTPVSAQQVAETVTALLRAGTTMLALDFDQTIATIHSGCLDRYTSIHLSTHVRPVFLLLLQEAHDQGLKVAIVTFSSRPDMQLEALAQVLPEEVVAALVMRAEDDSWHRPDGVPDMGKNCHMASAALEMGLISESEGPFCEQMGCGRVVLVDDDADNCGSAQAGGIFAVECQYQLSGHETEVQLLNDLMAIANIDGNVGNLHNACSMGL